MLSPSNSSRSLGHGLCLCINISVRHSTNRLNAFLFTPCITNLACKHERRETAPTQVSGGRFIPMTVHILIPICRLSPRINARAPEALHERSQMATNPGGLLCTPGPGPHPWVCLAWCMDKWVLCFYLCWLTFHDVITPERPEH